MKIKDYTKTKQESADLNSIPIQSNFKYVSEVNDKIFITQIENKQNISENIITQITCSICKNLLRNPVECLLCEESFCKECLEEREKTTKNCINGCYPIKSTFASIGLKNILNNLKLKCQYHLNGCNELFKYSELNLYYNHLKNCINRQIVCQKCKDEIPKSKIDNHISICNKSDFEKNLNENDYNYTTYEEPKDKFIHYSVISSDSNNLNNNKEEIIKIKIKEEINNNDNIVTNQISDENLGIPIIQSFEDKSFPIKPKIKLNELNSDEYMTNRMFHITHNTNNELSLNDIKQINLHCISKIEELKGEVSSIKDLLKSLLNSKKKNSKLDSDLTIRTFDEKEKPSDRLKHILIERAVNKSLGKSIQKSLDKLDKLGDISINIKSVDKLDKTNVSERIKDTLLDKKNQFFKLNGLEDNMAKLQTKVEEEFDGLHSRLSMFELFLNKENMQKLITESLKDKEFPKPDTGGRDEEIQRERYNTSNQHTQRALYSESLRKVKIKSDESKLYTSNECSIDPIKPLTLRKNLKEKLNLRGAIQKEILSNSKKSIADKSKTKSIDKNNKSIDGKKNLVHIDNKNLQKHKINNTISSRNITPNAGKKHTQTEQKFSSYYENEIRKGDKNFNHILQDKVNNQIIKESLQCIIKFHEVIIDRLEIIDEKLPVGTNWFSEVANKIEALKGIVSN